jgi:hypothetical protein
MKNMTGQDLKKAYWTVGSICDARLGELPEDEVAEKAGFGSPEAMRIQLKNWGLPDWMIGADPPKDEGRQRKARTPGEIEELPSAMMARELFSGDLERLNRALAKLPLLWEYLQHPPSEGKQERFGSMLLGPDHDPPERYREQFERRFGMAGQGAILTITVSNEEDLKRVLEKAKEGGDWAIAFPEERLERYRDAIEEAGLPILPIPEEDAKRIKQYEKYRKWCKDKVGLDLPRDEYPPLTSSLYTHGLEAAPWEGLVLLIAVHALVNGSVDALIEKLHPRPDEVDRAKLYDKKVPKVKGSRDGYVTELQRAARQIAQTVRGVKMSKGRQDAQASPEEMLVALDVIGFLAVELGYSDEEIFRELKEHLLDEEDRFWGAKFNVKRIRELRKVFVAEG